MWRDPKPRWVSPIGRVVQIGDSAHPFLPTSASGGTKAMDDAFALAACLQIAGKNDACLATKVHNHLRYVTVRCTLHPLSLYVYEKCQDRADIP